MKENVDMHGNKRCDCPQLVFQVLPYTTTFEIMFLLTETTSSVYTLCFVHVNNLTKWQMEKFHLLVYLATTYKKPLDYSSSDNRTVCSSVFLFLQASVHLLQKSFRANRGEAAARRRSYRRQEEHWQPGVESKKDIQIKTEFHTDEAISFRWIGTFLLHTWNWASYLAT